MGVGPGSPGMSPHEAPAWKLVGGTVGGDGAMFDVLGPVSLSFLAVPVPCALTHPARGLQMRWRRPGFCSPLCQVDPNWAGSYGHSGRSEGWESLTPHWALSGEWGLQPPVGQSCPKHQLPNRALLRLPEAFRKAASRNAR